MGTVVDQPPDLERIDLRDDFQPDLLEAVYRDLYLPNFPHVEMQEDPAMWAKRLRDPQPQAPQPVTHFCVYGRNLRDPDQREIAGFIIGEYYQRSACGLLTYVAVHSSARRKGLGKQFVRDMIGILSQQAAANGTAIRSVFAECEDPLLSDSNDASSFKAWERVEILARLGARHLPIRYVQPELQPGQGKCTNLRLLAFGERGMPPAKVSADAVREFLTEFYEALGVIAPQQNRDLKNSLEDIGRKAQPDRAGEYLVPQLMCVERPQFFFAEFGLALHFTHQLPDFDGNLPVATAEFDSMERDLTAYAYRDRRQFTSQLLSDPHHPWHVEIEIPPSMVYVAEGETKELFQWQEHQPRRRKLVAKLSCTTFRTGLVIYHLTFNPNPHLPADQTELNEWDLVKLSKLWEGGENVDDADSPHNIKQIVRFHLEGESHPMSIDQLARSLIQRATGRTIENDLHCNEGTIQLLTERACNEARTPYDWAGLWKLIRRALKDEVIEDAAGEDPREQLKQREADVLAVAGIVEGVLDFPYMDASELADVFDSFRIDDDSLIGIHKGTMLQISHDCRVYAVSSERVGISPYLLTPHSVLICNENLLFKALDTANQTEQTPTRSTRVFRKALLSIRKSVQRDLVPNVFHYPLEQWLCAHGHESRGLNKVEETVLDRLSEIEAKWEASKAYWQAIYERVITLLVLVLTIAQVVFGALPYWYPPPQAPAPAVSTNQSDTPQPNNRQQ